MSLKYHADDALASALAKLDNVTKNLHARDRKVTELDARVNRAEQAEREATRRADALARENAALRAALASAGIKVKP